MKGELLAIDWKGQPRRTAEDIYRVLDNADGPLRTWQIGQLSGLFHYNKRRGYRGWGGCWMSAHGRRGDENYQFVLAALRELRDEGRAVRLPHDLAGAATKHATCESLDHARALQLSTCEALLDKAKTEGARRSLLLVLDGLRGRPR